MNSWFICRNTKFSIRLRTRLRVSADACLSTSASRTLLSAAWECLILRLRGTIELHVAGALVIAEERAGRSGKEPLLRRWRQSSRS